MTIRENWRETRGARAIRERKSREIFPSIIHHRYQRYHDIS